MTKRRDLIKQIEKQGGTFVREGGGHTVYKSKGGKMFTIPRHKEIKETLAKKIKKQCDK